MTILSGKRRRMKEQTSINGDTRERDGKTETERGRGRKDEVEEG